MYKFCNCIFLYLAIVASQAQQSIISSVPPVSSSARFNDELVGHVVAAGGVTTLTSTGSMGISGTAGVSPPLTLIEPKFNYMTFNISNSSQIMSMIVINSQVNFNFKTILLSFIKYFFVVFLKIPLFHSQPTLKTYVRNAIERSIQEWINPVVERSVKIAVMTTETIVKKVRLS